MMTLGGMTAIPSESSKEESESRDFRLRTERGRGPWGERKAGLLAFPLDTSLAINPNTVLKAYRELEYAGPIESRPGQGTFLIKTLAGPSPESQARLPRSLRCWLREAQNAGLDEESIQALFLDAFQEALNDGGGAGMIWLTWLNLVPLVLGVLAGAPLVLDIEQGIESTVYLLPAIALLALTVWLVRCRLA